LKVCLWTEKSLSAKWTIDTKSALKCVAENQLAWWKWVVIVIGLLIIAVGAGRWVYQRVVASKAPPPPASPEEAAKELEAYYGYPVKPPPARR